ncbi:MAG TPA: hypothetical protein VFD92_05975 [Candidatus Binatia bacterium]|nr:hypothetical protein [Candidatus Binatia bacterium]
MAQEDQELVRTIVRSVDKKLEWEAIPTQDQGLRVTLRHPLGESSMDVSRSEVHAALDSQVDRNRLRERIKRCRQRVFDARKPYMPWRLPKIEPIGAPGPRSGWGGGGGGRR